MSWVVDDANSSNVFLPLGLQVNLLLTKCQKTWHQGRVVKHRFERWTIQQRTSLYNHYLTSESILYERLKETKRYQRENKDCQWLFPDKFVGIDQEGGLKPRANFPVRCQSNNPVTCIFLVIGWWGCGAGWGYISIIMELRFNRAIRMRLHIFGIKKLWYKGI